MTKRLRPASRREPTEAERVGAVRDQLTRLLFEAVDGKGVTSGEAFAAVYDALRRQARAAMHGRDRAHTLQPTDLAHATFLKLIRQKRDWEGRRRFLATAARAMRSILVDHARRRSRKKRSAAGDRVELESLAVSSFEDRTGDILVVDEALSRLAAEYPRHAHVVELRFFGGLGFSEIGALLGISARTAELDWQFAKAWLHVRLR